MRALATIDLKRDEAGILAAAASGSGVPVQIIGRERIRVLQDALREPGFVEEITGVAAVCEPAAMLAGAQTELLAPKTARDGVTVALAQDICGSSAWDQADGTT